MFTVFGLLPQSYKILLIQATRGYIGEIEENS